MLIRLTLLFLALFAAITFLDWLSSPVAPCATAIEQRGEIRKNNVNAEKYCSTGKVVAAWRYVGAVIDDWHDDLTAVATIVIAFFTTILGIFTVNLARSTRLAAEAADLSARAAIAIELPIIQIAAEKVGFGTATENERRFDYFWVSELIFSNLGRTKAFPIEIQCGLTEGDSLPKVPRYTYTKQFQIGAIFEPNAPKPSQFNYYDLLFESDLGFFNRVREKKVRLWFYCLLVYLDFMQNRREVGFCWERHEVFGGGRFTADPTPAYNRKT